MTERDRLLNELKVAANTRSHHRATLSEAQGRVVELRAKMRATKEAKALKAAKVTVVRLQHAWARACDSHDAVETELLTGLTGLEIFDATATAKAKNGQAALVQEAQAL